MNCGAVLVRYLGGAGETDARIAQDRMAYRLETSVPGVMDLSDQLETAFEPYGPDSRIPDTFAAHCLLARRFAERDVRFVQLQHQAWDQHGNLPNDSKIIAQSTDQPSAALVLYLKQRGQIEDTLLD